MTDNYKLVWECMNGGKVYLHPTHFEEELEENLFFAKCLAEKGKIVYLMPFYHSFQMKNPDATINGRLVDFKYPKKTVNWHNAIQTHIRNANRQGAAIVVIYFERDDIDRNQIARGLSTALQDGWNRHVREIWLLYSNGVLLEIPRIDIKSRSFIKQLL